MTRPAQAAATAALEVTSRPTRLRLSDSTADTGGSREVLARLATAVSELKALSLQPLLQNAVACLNGGNTTDGAAWAIKALEVDERSGFGWYLLAIAREQSGDFPAAITCYETALRLLPDHGELANNLGRLAFRLGQSPVAEKLFRLFLERFPNHPEGANNLACALREQGRYEEAIEVLRASLLDNPGHALVWNTLGTVMAEQGDAPNALVFFDEALRLAPDLAKAQYNRGNMALALGKLTAALSDCEAALAIATSPDERQMMRLARSTILINLGRVGEGWDEYEARLHPQFSDVTRFLIDRPRWEPGTGVAGKSVLVIAEQGLGDEILFANVLADLNRDLGPSGRLTLAVEPRLVTLFQRAFPRARVGAHATFNVDGRSVRTLPFLEGDETGIDLWTPMASLLRQYRRSAEAFPDTIGYLAPDPARVAHWVEVLNSAPAGRKVGLLWKSAVTNGARHRYFSPFDQWAPVLSVPAITFVNLQYGDCSAEIAQARAQFGVEIWTPPGIDLKQDLDEVAALTCALDLVIGFANATLNIAGACGVPTWLISTPGAWPRVGTDRYPWYPQARVFMPPAFAEWEPVMAEVAAALADRTLRAA